MTWTLTGVRRSFKEAGSRGPTDRAQVAELVDALASGASGLTAVKVRVLSWAPSLSVSRPFVTALILMVKMVPLTSAPTGSILSRGSIGGAA